MKKLLSVFALALAFLLVSCEQLTLPTTVVHEGITVVPITTTRNENPVTTTEEPAIVTTTDEPSVVTTTDEPVVITTTDEPVIITTTEEPVIITTTEEEPPVVVTTTEEEPPVVNVNYGSEQQPLTISEFLTEVDKLELADKAYSSEYFFVEGNLTQTVSVSTSMVLSLTDGNKTITTSSTKAESEVTKLLVNDKVVVRGYARADTTKTNGYYISYNNGASSEDYKAPIVLTRTPGTSAITASAEHATVESLPSSALNDSIVSFTVVVEQGYELTAVKANGTTLEANNGVYSATVAGTLEIIVLTKEVGVEEPDPVTVTNTIEAIATAYGWQDTQPYLSFKLEGTTNGVVTVSVTEGGNNGKYYNNGKNWRLYQTNSPTLTISVPQGYKLVSVRIEYSPNNDGTLLLAGEAFASGSTDTTCAGSTTATFTVGNTSTASNGQVRITSIQVLYIPKEEPKGKITAEDINVAIDATETIVATSEGQTVTYTYEVTDPTVASVDANGVVTGLKAGETTITITNSLNFEKVIAVTVYDPNKYVTDLSLSDVELTIETELSATLTANVTGDPGCDTSVEYVSSNPSVATVDANGVINALSVGTTTITVTTVGLKNDKTPISKTCQVAVVNSYGTQEAPLSSSAVLALSVTGEFSPKQVFVSGVITALTISDQVTTDLIGSSMTLTLDNALSVTLLDHAQAIDRLFVGDTVVIEGFIRNENSALSITKKEATAPMVLVRTPGHANVTLSNIDSKVVISGLTAGSHDLGSELQFTVSIDENQYPGFAILAVKANSIGVGQENNQYIWLLTEDTVITVEVVDLNAYVSSVEISGDSSVRVDHTITLQASVTGADGCDQTVTWSSLDETIATVDENGLVTPLKPGVVTIKAVANGKTQGEAEVSDTFVVTVLNFTLVELTQAGTQVSNIIATLIHVNGKNAVVDDGTSYGWVYGSANFSGVKAGDIVLVSGTTATFNHGIEIASASLTQAESQDERPLSTKVELTAEHAAELFASDLILPSTKVYFRTTGLTYKNDKYVEYKLGNTCIQCFSSLSKGTLEEGKAYDLEGYLYGRNDGCLYLALVQATEVKGAITIADVDNIEVEQTVQLVPTSEEYPGAVYTYVSSDTNKATVSESGLVTGVATGNVTITVTNDLGYSATKTLAILPKTSKASSEAELVAALSGDIKEIHVTSDFSFGSDLVAAIAASNGYTIDLGGHTLTNTSLDTIELENMSLAIENGVLISLEYTNHTQSFIWTEANTTLILNNVTIECSGTGVQVRGDTTLVTITDSYITGYTYAVASNAAAGGSTPIVVIDHSMLTALGYGYNPSNNSTDGDSAGLMFNIQAELTITNTTIIGGRQGAIIRGGIASFENCTITNTGEWVAQGGQASKYTTTTWGAGNELPTAALVVGNAHATNYQYDTEVTLDSISSLVSSNPDLPLIYLAGVYGDGANCGAMLTVESPANLTLDQFKTQGDDILYDGITLPGAALTVDYVYDNTKVTVDETSTGPYHDGDTLTFTLEVENGYGISSVKVGTTPLTATAGVYSLVLSGSVQIIIEVEEVTVFPLEYHITTGALPTGWTGNGEKFATKYYALKGSGKYIQAENILTPQTSVVVSVTGVCNGTTTDSTVTVYGLDKDGNVVAGSAQTFTPDKASATTASAVDGAKTIKTVTISGTGITGIKIVLTVKGHNYVITDITISEPEA